VAKEVDAMSTPTHPRGHTDLSDPATMPTDISGQLSPFDKVATHADRFASRPWFFAMCVLLVVVWAPSFFLFGSVDTWQLIINTVTTIVTFLLVALLQNTQTRNDQATQDKLNAVAAALADVITLVDQGADAQRLRRELREAVGLEDRTSS
jgi:low affinity Fe/Cu permease